MPRFRPSSLKVVAVPLFLISIVLTAHAQITSTADATQTPVAGAGHDYFKMVNETVNPEMGTVSLSIKLPVAPGRKLNLPFSFQYSSGGALFLGASWSQGWGAQWTSTLGPLNAGGWSYAFPSASRVSKTYTVPPQPPSPDSSTFCSTTLGYTFVDANGTQHNLNMAHVFNNYPTSYYGNNYPVNYACQMSGFTSSETDSGGDPIVLSNLSGATSCQGCSGPSDGAINVADPDGTVYSFGSGSYMSPIPQSNSYPILLNRLEDRNGNILRVSYTTYPPRNPQWGQVSGFTMTDTLGRSALVATSFGQGNSTISIDGFSQPYTATWSAFNYSGYNVSTLVEGPDPSPCPGTSGSFPGQAGSESVITSLTLPNSQKYQFTYDPTYGTLTKIVYPSGGYVSYTYGVNHLAASVTSNGNDLTTVCFMYVDTASVLHRYVSFDGSTVAQQQDFTYSTTQNGAEDWSSKTTTVVTHDLLRGNSFQTIYTYAPIRIACGPNGGGICSTVGVERTITYYDTNGALLETVWKGWYDQYREACELHQIGSSSLISGVFYTYSTQGGQVTDKKEFNYGQISSGSVSTVCPAVGTPAPPSSPTRETVTNYQSFGVTPIFNTAASILDRPSSTMVYGFVGGVWTKMAETDFLYDQNSVGGVSGLPSGTHDETSYAAGSASPRGNLTTTTRQCFSNCTNSVTTYSYDETGQVLSMLDPCGNATCSDMTGTNHTASFSYADSYNNCGGTAPPSGNSNAYVTQITYPQTGSVSHVVHFCYGYDDGQLRGTTDQNGQTTTYQYNDSLKRLTETDYPDTGKTIVSYDDAPPNPTITTTTIMNSSQSIITEDVLDGVGHQVNAEITSDPQGTVKTDRIFDGLGHVRYQYNPYRSTSDQTYGYTTYNYDALGRPISVIRPDGSTVATSYCNGSGSSGTTFATLVTDEAGHWRRSQTDGLGRLVEVDEPNSPSATVNVCPGSGEPIWTTNYAYDALDDLLTVSQGGSRNRSFSYDPLKRMTQSNNPESGRINYTYDSNGNVATKVDARTITTNYAYDVLNRPTGMTYSNGDPSVSYSYDQSGCAGQPSPCYNVGHRTGVSDAGGSESFAYERMGREVADQRVTNGLTKSAVYSYDLAGDVTTLIYPTGQIVDYTYDSAGRPSTAQAAQSGTYYVKGTCPTGASNNGACYAPQGAISQMENGANVFTTYLYNKRLQPCWIFATAGTPLATNTACSGSDPGNAILDLQYNFNAGQDNGNVLGITNKRDTTRSQSFSYDQVNRIVSAQTSATSGSTCWGETYSYDQWANLQAIATPSAYAGCPNEGNWSAASNANNQLPSYVMTYDASGNTLNDNFNTYQWNAEGELKFAAGVNYTYDGDGNRLSKSTGETYWYGLGGEILGETDSQGNPTDEYIFFAGKRVTHISY